MDTKPLVTLRWKLFSLLSGFDTSKCAFILLALLCLQPFYGAFTNESTQTNVIALFCAKAAVIRVIGIVALLNGLVDYFCKSTVYGSGMRKSVLKNTPWAVIFLVLLVWSFICCLTAKDVYGAFYGGPYRYDGYISYLAYAGIFLSAQLVRKEGHKSFLFAETAIISTAVAILVLLKELTHTDLFLCRAGTTLPYSGTFINPNHYAYYLCVALAVIIGLFTETDDIIKKILYAIAFSINLATLLLNQGLGSYIALLVAFVFYAVCRVIRDGVKKSWSLSILAVILVLMTIFINGGAILGDITTTGAEIGKIGQGIEQGDVSNVNGGSGRFQIWLATLKITKDHPIFGVGPDNVQNYMEAYGQSSLQMPHNEYLQIAANTGIFGGLLYIAALVVLFAFCIKNLKKLTPATLIAGTAAVAYAVSSFFGVSMVIMDCYMFLFLGLCGAWKREESVRKLQTGLEEKIKALSAASVPAPEKTETEAPSDTALAPSETSPAPGSEKI